MFNKDFLIFMGQVALTFRLSEENLKILFSLDGIDDLGEQLIEADAKNKYAYKYLFYSETFNEPEDISIRTLRLASAYLKKFAKVSKEGDKEEINKTMSKLNKVDVNFNKVCKTNKFIEDLTLEDMEAISKYRIKYGMSITAIAKVLDMKGTSLSSRERAYEDPLMLYRLGKLNDYNYTVGLNKEIWNKSK